MNLLITGATGFIGTHLTKLLVNEGHEVTALVRTESKRKLLPSNVKIIKGDLSIFEDENLVLPPFDIIIHLAGVIFAPNKAAYLAYNYEAVKTLVACVQRQDWTLKRFLFASSLAASGPSDGDMSLMEQSQSTPIEAYGKAKLKTEQFLATITTFPTTSFRPAIVLGAGDEHTLTLFKMAKNRVGMSVNGKPQYLSFVDIDDLNEAILKMMAAMDNKHHTYFVAHPQTITNIQLFKTLATVVKRNVFIIPLPKVLLYLAMQIASVMAQTLGIKNQLDAKQYQQLTHHFVCSSKKLKKTLDWEPKYNLQTSLQKAYEGYKAMKMLS